MAGKSVLDNYDQFAALSVLGGVGASGQTTSQLITGITNMQKIAWAVARIEYSWPTVWDKQFASAEYFTLSLGASSAAYSGHPALSASVYDYIMRYSPYMAAAPVTHTFGFEPAKHEFPEGNRLLVLPSQLYLTVTWAVAAGLTAVAAQARIYYKEVELGPEDWYDLLQMRMPLGAV